MKPKLTEPNKEDIIYTAGLFDGEGSVFICRRKDGYQQLKGNIGSTYFSIIQRLRYDIWVIGHITFTPPRGHHSSYWEWQFSSNDALWLLEHIYPYLYIKKRRAELAILFQRWTLKRMHNGNRPKCLPELQLDEDVYTTMRYLNSKPPPSQDIKLPVFDILRS